MRLFKSRVIGTIETPDASVDLTLFTPDNFAVRIKGEIIDCAPFPWGPGDPVKQAKDILQKEAHND